MSREILLAAGCSFTDPNFRSLDASLKESEKGGWPMWPEIIAKRLNFKSINMGKYGAGNDYIFNQVVDQLHIQKNIKLVIVMWSGWDRFNYMGKLVTPIPYFLLNNLKELEPIKEVLKDHSNLSDYDNTFFNMDQDAALKYSKNLIDTNLRYMFLLSYILKEKNIPYIFLQGVKPFPYNGLNLVENIKFKYTTKMILNDLLNNVYFEKLDKDPNIMGFPFLKPLNGFCIRDFVITEKDIISPSDTHPNKHGQIKIANSIMDFMKVKYSDA
jgi:hypothetical protein